MPFLLKECMEVIRMQLLLKHPKSIRKWELPDDWRMYELFADLSLIPESASDEEITQKMSKSELCLVCESTGEHILFKDYADCFTTLVKAGIRSDKIYSLISNWNEAICC